MSTLTQERLNDAIQADKQGETTMKAEVVYLTPAKAKEYLKMNVGNRSVKNVKNAYEGQMLAGEWKENGEGIIIDTNGFIKDGQHRLIAMISANFSYWCVIITGVNPDVMDTIDTGANRSLHDVLGLNGFTYANDIASITKIIIKTERGGLGMESIFKTSGAERGSKTSHLSNNRCLTFCKENRDGLLKLVRAAGHIYEKCTIRVLTKSEIAFYLYLFGGYDFNKNHVNFMKRITGLSVQDGSTSRKINRRLVTAKLNKDRLEREWKRSTLINGWNIFCGGDYAIHTINVAPSKIQEIKTFKETENG